MAPRPFRFSVSAWSAPSGADWRATARKAENLGFDMLVVPDHLSKRMFPPLPALASAAEATTRLRIGTLVLNNDFRHPALVARDAATLDLLSDGRFELGLGAGHMQDECAQLGVTFDDAPTRIARLSESVKVIRGLLAGETVDFEGEHYTIRGHELSPMPIQRPLPLLIGGNGRAVLELAAREASTVGFTGFFPGPAAGQVRATHFTAARLEQRIALVRAAAGERFASLELHALVQAVLPSDDPRQAAAGLIPRAPGLTVDDLLRSPFLLFGSPQSMADALLLHRERLGLSHFTVFEPAMDAFAPVIARLAGR
jgi:probable F420-dependent oxidoreductase